MPRVPGCSLAGRVFNGDGRAAARGSISSKRNQERSDGIGTLEDCLGDSAHQPYDDSTSLQVLNVNLDVKVLATPLSVYLADGRHVDYAEQVTVVFELVTGAGPVHMRDVQCLVLECDVEEQLLGNDPMKSLSIDVEGMIEQLAGPSLLTEEKAEFPIGDSLPSAVEGDEDVCDSDGTLACLEDTAVDNGLDVKYVSQLRSLGREYGDIFHRKGTTANENA
ncbi:hypothetical protein PC123_g22450 [Phytophthora cactorum]|nr:hypothetical protein PC123_g22450 [Phytophthora cactorum]